MKLLRCSMSELIEAAFRFAMLRHGCNSCEIAGLSVEGALPHGGSVALASVRAPDGRELFRVYDLDDLEGLLANPTLCQSLATAVQKLVRKTNLDDTGPYFGQREHT